MEWVCGASSQSTSLRARRGRPLVRGLPEPPMKALTFKRYGKSPEIGFSDVPRPTLKADELLVQVHAASVNPSDNMIPTGPVQGCREVPTAGVNQPQTEQGMRIPIHRRFPESRRTTCAAQRDESRG
jgi:hypothetical protein